MPKIAKSIMSIEGLDIEVVRKKMKHMTIRVSPPLGEVKISAPLRSSDTLIRRFAATHIAWIHKHQLPYQGARLALQLQYQTGERHLLYGREYILRVHERLGRAECVLTDDTYIDLYVPYGADMEKRKKVLDLAYRQLLQAQIEMLIPLREPLIGQSASEYRIRTMRTQWGSCNPRTRRIWLNLELIKQPLACIEYVFVHELVHLLEASHNARFKALMDKFLPDWRVRKAMLNESKFARNDLQCG